MMEGELASWDLCFAITKFCTCRLRPPRRHTSRASAASWGPVQPAPVQPSASHRAARALTARPSFPGGARTRAPSLQPSSGLQGRGPGPQRARGMASARPNVWFLKLSLPLERRDVKAEAVPAACAAACARLNLRSGPGTPSPRPWAARLMAELAKLAPVLGKFRRAPTWLPRGERSPGPREGR